MLWSSGPGQLVKAGIGSITKALTTLGHARSLARRPATICANWEEREAMAKWQKTGATATGATATAMVAKLATLDSSARFQEARQFSSGLICHKMN